VDEQVLERTQELPVGIERAFALFADAHNLEAITPPWLAFRVVTPRPIEMEAGTLLDYRLRLHGLPVRWRTRIESWDPPHGFVDAQLNGPYALWEHTHELTEPGVDRTLVCDRIRYRIGFGPLGSAAHRLFVRRDLERIFDYRREAVLGLL
jgi:ligand-binding SRPBCC domain-containing protein